MHNTDEMAANGLFCSENFENQKISMQWSNNNKSIFLNNKKIFDRKEIIYNLPCIVFCHDDLDFVIGNPEKKRVLLDQTLSLTNKNYVDSLRKYKNILKNKNIVLKESKDKELISIYNSQLVSEGLKIIELREEIILKMNIIISSLFFKVSDMKEKLVIDYISSWKELDKNSVLDSLNDKIDYEIKMKTSCYGPHRDNFKYKYGNLNFVDIASTGQKRLLSLILRAAQGIFYSKTTGKKPILLLDDVLLELDPEKRVKFLKLLPDYQQAFFTFLPDSNILKDKKGKIIRVSEGRIVEEN